MEKQAYETTAECVCVCTHGLINFIHRQMVEEKKNFLELN